MTLLNASFEVSPSGAAIPLTGGADGFSVAGYNGGGTTWTSDSSVLAAVAAGSFAAKLTVGGSAAQNWRGWSWSGSVVHLRQYVYLTASPNARFTWWENYASGGYVSRIRLNTDRTIGVSDGTSIWSTSAPIPLNTLVRVEASFDHAASSMSIAIYLGNSTTAIVGGTASTSSASFSTSSITSIYGGIQSTLTNFTIRTDAWAISDTAQPGPLVAGGTVAGVAAPTVTAVAPAGTVSAVVGEVVTIVGVTPQVVAQGGERPIPPAPPSGDPTYPPDPYRAAIRSGSYALTYLVDADVEGVPVEGATGLRPTGGTITDTTKPGVRRVLNLDLAPEPGLFDRLAPIGTTLTVTARITYLNRQSFDLPMGVFDVDSETLSEGGGGLSLTAPDKWVRIQRARFVGPASSTRGMLVVDQIAELIRGALGPNETVLVSSTSTATVGALVWEKDRDKAIIDLAASIGAWVYFDRTGVATIADVPTVGASADWLIDASVSGVLIELDRERSRTETRNVVVVESSAAGDAPFPAQYVWDDDPSSPTYAGTDPANRPDLAGPFGVVVEYFDSPVLESPSAAVAAGLTILARVTGLASQISLGQVPNPALDAFDVIDVLPPRERYDIARVLERHVADSVTHPLGLGAQHIEGRSTRTDPLGGVG